MVHTNASALSPMKENSANSKIKWSDLKEIKELMRKEGRGIKTASETRAENGLKNAKSKSTGIISLKNTVAGQKDLIKWPNVLGLTLQSLVTLLAFQQKLKQEKSNLSVQTVHPQEKKLKLCENVVGKSRKISGDNRIFGTPNFFQ